MSSDWQLDNGIHSIKSAWRREHTAKVNLEKTLEQAEAENAKLRELIADLWEYIYIGTERDGQSLHDRTRELGVEVD